VEASELWQTAARAVAVYAVMLFIVRLSGKRTIGNFSAFDLLVALMLGEVVDEIIYGDVTIAQGMTAIVTVALLQYGNSWLSYAGLDGILEGKPAVLVRNGELQISAMRRERLNSKDVMHELRLQGVNDVAEVRLATLENDGQISVLREEWAEPLQKGDLRKDAKKEKTEGQRTDSPEALGEGRG
jgi:uncharacterized membrane protein YcaP (DUF421 family)